MTNPHQIALAHRFGDLHQGPAILVLPNAWDVTSARIFEEAGFPAIGTSSAAIANSLGHPDGQRVPRSEMLAVVKRIVDAVKIPVTADLEAGYGKKPEEVAETAYLAIGAGAVGMNLEDADHERPNTLVELNLQTEIIRTVTEASQNAGIPFVLNARTDVFLACIGDPTSRLDRTVERLNAYRDAGARSLFAPGVSDKTIIALLARAIRGPLNILATVGTPSIAELQQLGVARVSLGSGPMRAAMGLLARMARQLREEGSFSLMTDGAMPYPEANRLVFRS